MTDLWNIYFDVKSISNRTNSFKNPEFGDTFLTDLICLRAWASLMSLCCICNKHVSVTHHPCHGQLTRKAVAMVADLLIPAQQLTRTLVSGPSSIAALIQSPVSYRE